MAALNQAFSGDLNGIRDADYEVISIKKVFVDFTEKKLIIFSTQCIS